MAEIVQSLRVHYLLEVLLLIVKSTQSSFFYHCNLNKIEIALKV